MQPDAIVRLLGIADAPLLDGAAEQVFDNPVNSVLVRAVLGDPRHHIAAAIVDGRLVGFASGVHYIHTDKPAQMFINEVGVAPSWQRRGLGKAILDALLAHARQLGCTKAWVLTEPDNGAARGLYAAAGAAEHAAPSYFVFDIHA